MYGDDQIVLIPSLILGFDYYIENDGNVRIWFFLLLECHFFCARLPDVFTVFSMHFTFICFALYSKSPIFCPNLPLLKLSRILATAVSGALDVRFKREMRDSAKRIAIARRGIGGVTPWPPKATEK